MDWSPDLPNLLACGSQYGEVEIWDCVKKRKLTVFNRRSQKRINSLSWNYDILYSGCEGGELYQQDIRVNRSEHKINENSKIEILGVKSQHFDHRYLLESSMNCKMKVWNLRMKKVEKIFNSQ